MPIQRSKACKGHCGLKHCWIDFLKKNIQLSLPIGWAFVFFSVFVLAECFAQKNAKFLLFGKIFTSQSFQMDWLLQFFCQEIETLRAFITFSVAFAFCKSCKKHFSPTFYIFFSLFLPQICDNEKNNRTTFISTPMVSSGKFDSDTY